MIYGASETGKSFMVEAIDYMLGARDLKSIQEADGYTAALLGLRLPDGEIITLYREFGSSKVLTHNGDHRDLPATAPEAILSTRHDSRSNQNLSRYLLKIIGADGRMVLKNSRRQIRSLSFRDLAHLCIINESQMASPRPVVLTSGQKTLETAEKSVFKYLLTGQDDSAHVGASDEVETRVGKGKIELLDHLIREATDSLVLGEEVTPLNAQLSFVENAMASVSADVSILVSQRSQVASDARETQELASSNRMQATEIQTLVNRFGLLCQQYESDLARLEMVGEAGNLLGYFRTGTCVFCGAAPEHQRPGHHAAETTALKEAVTAEIRKTADLRADLLTTIDDLNAQLAGLEVANDELHAQASSLESRLADLDRRLAPLHTDTTELLSVRSQILTDLAVFAQIQRMEDAKAALVSAPTAPPTRLGGLPTTDVAEFEQLVQQILQSWQVPGDKHVAYDEPSAEVSVGGRPRSARGKGMRSIIHAAFSTALVQYAAQRALVHPGFVVLDSPVLTYREPRETDVQLTHNVVERFYRGLIHDVPAQVVVVENGDPPNLDGDALVYAFRTPGSDRVGFFPG
ncbi:hypothetical protein [Catenulispora sp. EB89]|uniref:hypothetical protein n=1 Tax=Catenulispora sp. EB89 TaxID=3156257 RepID=UPI00351149D3